MDASNLIIGHALKGAGDTDFVMYYSVTMAWLLLVPGQLLIVNVLKGSIIWCWLWTAFYIAVLGLGYILRFRRDRWKSIDLMGRQPPTEPARGAAEALVVD
jgi:MATE family multidrug resistance protein